MNIAERIFNDVIKAFPEMGFGIAQAIDQRDFNNFYHLYDDKGDYAGFVSMESENVNIIMFNKYEQKKAIAKFIRDYGYKKHIINVCCSGLEYSVMFK